MDDKIQVYLGDSGKEKIFVDAQEVVTGRTCVIAQSGAGKSWTIAVICEQLLKNNIGFCIIDTEGEYYSLKQKFQVLWVGGQNADVDLESADLDQLCRKAIKENIPMIFDVSDVLEERKLVAKLASILYSTASDLRIPYLLIVEEADKFVPQSKDSLKELEEISKRGRKRGLGILIATQRPSLVNKNVLSQCGNQFLGKLTTENDLKAVDLFFPNRKELEELPKLNPGEFFICGNVLRQKKKVKIAMRETQHKGLTPKLIPKPIGKISEMISEFDGTQRSGSWAEEKPPEQKKGAAGQKEYQFVETIRGPNAFSPSISKEKALQIADSKRKKKFVLFGKKEAIANVNQAYRPLVFVEVKMLEGFLRKNFNTYSFIVDGITGKIAEIENGLRFFPGFLLGLSDRDAKVLFALAKSKKASVAELELRAKLSEDTVREILKKLGDQGLVTYNIEKKTKFYSPLQKTTVPNLKKKTPFPHLDTKSSGECKIKKEELRSIVKAQNPNSDITKFQVFFYPVWKISLENRKIEIDGMTGKELFLQN